MKGRELLNSKCRTDWLTAITEWVHNEDDRKMLERYLLDGLTVEAVAEEFNLSTVRTQHRITRARNQLFRHI